MRIKKIKNVKFDITTSNNHRFACKKCGKYLEGKKGFVRFIFECSEKGNWSYSEIDKYIYICRECFDEIVKSYEKDKQKGSKIYNERVKKRMLIELNRGNKDLFN